jgi:hypothetical protein
MIWALILLACTAAVAETAHNTRVLHALAAKDEPALLSALGVRGNALGELLASRDVAAALELARGAPRARGALSPAARALLQDEWASAVVEVATLRGLPLRGATAASLHAVFLTFPCERRVRMHPASVTFAGLPPAGSTPVQGFFFNGSFVADRAGAECGGTREGGLVECVVGGEARAFVSHAAAEAHVAALRRAGARGLQMGADPAIALPQPFFDANLTSGRRRAIFISVRFKGQSVSDTAVVPPAELLPRAQDLELLHGQRSFGKVTFTTAIVNCPIELPLSAADYISIDVGYFKLMNDAIAAAGDSSCSPFTKSAILGFDHIALFHPTITCFGCDFSYAGLGLLFNKFTWYNGRQNAADDSLIAHEIGHNYGLNHAATWPANDAFKEYGDLTDVMGDSDSMVVGDYSAAAKIAMGWIPSSRYVAFHPQGSNAATGLVSTSSFLLAALDRDNAIGVDPFNTAYPSNVALAARLTIPPHLTAVATKRGIGLFGLGTSVYAFLYYRAMDLVPGVYMNEVIYDTYAMGYPTLVCNEPLCVEQAPLAGAHDAFVYDRNGTRALIEVGALTPGVVPTFAGVINTDLQNSAFQVSVSYLGANGRKLGVELPAGCSATTGLCASNVFTEVASTGTFTRSLSASAPVALFRVTNPSNGAVTISACISGSAPYSAPIGVSAFLSGFPTAHAFYSGSLGVSGDAVAPGMVPSTPYPQCETTTVTVANGVVVWVAVGSPGFFRGRSLSVSVFITLGGGIPLPASGSCAKGSFKRNGACVLCPIRGQSSSGSAISEQECFCPVGFYPSQTAAGCVGQELGGPNAVSASVAAFPPCPLGKALSGGACIDCPVGSWPSPSTSYGSACTFKFYKVIEVNSVVSSGNGFFTRNGLDAGATTYSYTRSGGSSVTWKIDSTDRTWKLYGSPSSTIPLSAPFSANFSGGVLQLINNASVAFCDSVGDSTVDYLGRRVCYCGAGMQKDANNVCQTCPTGQNRSMGGAASKVEICSSTTSVPSVTPSISASQSNAADNVS